MLVLGVSDGLTGGAALVRDGEILAVVSEERLSRLKMAFGFPRESIAEVMRIADVAPDQIDLVAEATQNNHFYNDVRPFTGWLQDESDEGFVRNAIVNTVSGFGHLVDRLPVLESLYYAAKFPIYASRRSAIRRIFKQELGIGAPVRFVDHHLCHAASAYFTSGFDDALALTMDGGGDRGSSVVYLVRNGVFRKIGETSAFNSLGNYYSYITHICGYKAQKHEGKITGLAAHGKPIYRDLLDSLITFDAGEIKNVGGQVFRGAVELIESRLPHGWSKIDLAASIQQHSEDLAVAYVKHYVPMDNSGNLAIAGGLFANVRINQRMLEIDGVNRLFVHPGMTDCGMPVGAALEPCINTGDGKTTGWKRDVIQDVYYGTGYSLKEMEQALRDNGLEFSRSECIEKDIAELLTQGYVVARFNGRMEYGPRALGNRSILYQPADPAVNDWLNKCLDRTEFMPFAPSVLMKYTDQCFHNHNGAEDSARFMTITFDCTDWMKRHCAGVVHVDGTARPQLVKREDNESYWAIIDEFRKLTDVPVVINTSFNMHEEPIVCSPRDAIRAFRLGHLDYLAIGDFLVPSPEPITHALVPMRITAMA